MGSNRRYADAVDRRMDQRILERIVAENEPDTLQPSELELETEPLTRSPTARPVRACVRYAGTAVWVDALATAWTEHAVAIKWRTPSGGEHRAWVWASAVRKRVE